MNRLESLVQKIGSRISLIAPCTTLSFIEGIFRVLVFLFPLSIFISRARVGKLRSIDQFFSYTL